MSTVPKKAYAKASKKKKKEIASGDVILNRIQALIFPLQRVFFYVKWNFKITYEFATDPFTAKSDSNP